MIKTRIILVVLLVLNTVFSVRAIQINLNVQEGQEYSYAPFSITVEPKNITVKTGEDIVFLIGIEAEEGFTSKVDLELEVSFVGYNMTLNMFPLNPPFPRLQEATIEVPSLARAGIFKGILKATSGDHIVINTIQISLLSEDDTSDAVRTLSEAPFTIFTDQKKLTAKPGENVIYHIDIIADEGFNGSIRLVDECFSLNYTWTSNARFINPPYPKHGLFAEFSIPEYIVPGVAFHHTLEAISGIYSIEKSEKIIIVSPRNGLGVWIIQIFNRLYSELLAIYLKLTVTNPLNDPGMYQDILDAKQRVMLPYYGDESTMIYHRSRSTEYQHISRENRRFFSSKEAAEQLGYRACSICKP